MSAVLVASFACLLTAGLVLVVRRVEGRAWRSRLVAFRLGLTDGLTTDDVARWLGTVTTTVRPSRFALLTPPPVVVEVVATRTGIAHYLIFTNRQRRMVLASLRAALPVRLDDAAAYLHERPAFHLAAELRLWGGRPLAYDRGQSASAAYLAAIQPLYADERVTVQLIAGGASTPTPDSDNLQDARARHRQPLVHLAVRVGVAAKRRDRAGSLLSGVVGGLRLLNAPGAQLVRRWLPSPVTAGRLQRRTSPLGRWPFTINTLEAAGFFGMAPGVYLPGLSVGGARQLPPAQSMARTGCVIATSNYPGISRPLALRLRDRLAHTYIPGPTGVGKSTLMVNMALQDIAAGLSVVFVDPKGDAIPDLLARTPAERHSDVMVINPAAVGGHVVGWNVLQMKGGELARELAVDHAVNVLHELWRDSWGPRTADVLRASLLTLAYAKAPDGTAFAITDVAELLTNDHFRRFVLAQRSVPPSVRGFWDEYNARSTSDRAAVIGPSMNKLRAFSTRTALRLLLGQSQGIDLGDVFTKRRILLVSLGKGTIGPEAAHLVGSLLVSGIWQECLHRVTVPAELRRPVMCYIDEAQDVVRLPLADMLAQARGLGMGLVLANQSLAQLPEAMQSALLGVARTQVAFQLGHDDAKVLARSFGPLTAKELQGLAAHEVAIRACVNGQTLRPVTGTTLPLPPPVHDGLALADASRQRFGVPRSDVETAMAGRLLMPASGPIGRQLRRTA